MTTNSSSAAKSKSLSLIGNTISIPDGYGNSYLLIRSWNRKGFYNIARREVLTDGKIPNRDGLIPDAIFFTNEEVADLLTESEERTRRLENIDSLLGEWLGLRRSRSRRTKQRLHQLQRKEVAK